MLSDPLLKVVFGERLPFPDKRGCAQKSVLPDAVDDFSGVQMRFELCIGPRGLELLDQIRGTHHFFLQLADQFDCSGIDEADVRNIIFGRILHGDRFAAGKQFGQRLVKFFPTRVNVLTAIERIEHARFDSVDELSRLAFRRNEVKPAARGKAVARQVSK